MCSFVGYSVQEQKLLKMFKSVLPVSVRDVNSYTAPALGNDLSCTKSKSMKRHLNSLVMQNRENLETFVKVVLVQKCQCFLFRVQQTSRILSSEAGSLLWVPMRSSGHRALGCAAEE